MSFRPSKRVVWLIIPLVPVVLMSGLMWLGGRPDDVDLATRGAKPPPERKFSLTNPGSWSRSTAAGDWLDDSVDSLMYWEYNPWRKHRDGTSVDIGERLRRLQESDRPEDREEAERLKNLGREWYERILARYPDLARSQEKEIPREENGFLQWSELVKRLVGEKKESLFDKPMSREMDDNFRKETPQNPEDVKAWVEANRGRIDEIRAIGLLPGQSALGVPDEDRSPTFLNSASRALMLDAEAAVASGDINRAMESIRAANGLLDHHSNLAFPTLYDTLASASLRNRIQNHVLTQILPSLPSGQADVAAWQALLNPRLQQPSDFARTLRGEWNVTMPGQLLPALSDNKDATTPPDGDYLAESYTRHMREMAAQAEGATLADYAASPKVNVVVSDLSRRSREAAEGLGVGGGWDARSSFLRSQERIGLTQAAFAIMNGQEIPLDPVYGHPYKWDPVKRELSLPDPPGGRKFRERPIKVPKM